MKKNARTKKESKLQYTVRAVPPSVDKALRRKALAEKKSLNKVLVEALLKEAGTGEAKEIVFHDLDPLAGRWVKDPDFDEAIASQDRIDRSLWK